MPKLTGGILFTGTIDNLSAYKVRGSDEIRVRRKGGPTKEQIKKAPQFDLTRRNNKEFGGRAKFAARIKRILAPMLFITDYNLIGPLNALLKPIQKMDTLSEWGKRNILLTKHPRLLEGFSLNRRNLLDSIVRTPVSGTIQKQEAIIDIPALLPEINFKAPDNYNWYQFIAVAGLIPDLYCTEYGYRPKDDKDDFCDFTQSAWLPVNTPAPACKLIIQGLPERKPDHCSIMMAVGIAFGTLQGSDIQPVKYVGGAKIIAMV